MDVYFQIEKDKYPEEKEHTVEAFFQPEGATVRIVLGVPKSLNNLDDLTREALKRGRELLLECADECSKRLTVS